MKLIRRGKKKPKDKEHILIEKDREILEENNEKIQ